MAAAKTAKPLSSSSRSQNSSESWLCRPEVQKLCSVFLSVWSFQPQGHVLQLPPALSRRLADSLIRLLLTYVAITWATLSLF